MDFTPTLTYIADYWPHIIRCQPCDDGTRIGLPRPYLVPSDGAMFQEMYYWDSYFMALGVVGTAHESLVGDMAENMAYLFERFGVIPNASRYYFLSRSQPPFLTQLTELAYTLKQRRGDPDAQLFLRRMTTVAALEHETVWRGAQQPHYRLAHRGLSRYFDVNYLDSLASCESGWDHSTRCADRWLDHLPVDLNSILYARERDMAQAYETLGDTDNAAAWRARAATRAATMRRLLWDGDAGFFFDYDYVSRRRNSHPSLAGFYPLWAGWATPAQAARVVRDWLPRFEKRGGLVTSLKAKVGRQWAWPNGWAPLQWIVVGGLQHYGYRADARRIMEKWCAHCAAVFAQTGALWEKYNVVKPGARPEAGLYGSIKGFGWSNGVFVDFVRRLKAND
ncbi:MAG: trehalase family glycosidase [Chloroflexota bacterium]